MRWTLPNALTVGRLLAAPMVPVMFLYFHRPWADWFALGLFLLAAVTDWFDGFLARAWKQESRFGAMLDPIADKAMVAIALLVIVGYSGLTPWLLFPATIILFREVFVSGLREFLGEAGRALTVTRLAKWKTTVQMVAIAVLFLATGLEHVHAVAAGVAGEADPMLPGPRPAPDGAAHASALTAWLAGWAGIVLLWLAAGLTAVTGWDYFRKAVPLLEDGSHGNA